MIEQLSNRLVQFLQGAVGKEVSLQHLRTELQIDPASNSWENIRVLMYRLSKAKSGWGSITVRPTGRKDGTYKVLRKATPVRVFGTERERSLPFDLHFPKDYETGIEMDFADNVVVREGDMIVIGGVSNYGKTTTAINFCGENIDYFPVLMGNEYTTRVGDTDEYEPTPRFLERLDNMNWVEWTNGDNMDKFTLLPVKSDYAENIVKDKINIIDWVNLKADRLYDISQIMEDIKSELGHGIAIVVLQKGAGDMARGGQFTKDFTDCELLIDKYSETESMLTVGKVKEVTHPVMGKTYAFGIIQGVKIVNFREIVKCPTCRGNGFVRGSICERCNGRKYVDKEVK